MTINGRPFRTNIYALITPCIDDEFVKYVPKFYRLPHRILCNRFLFRVNETDNAQLLILGRPNDSVWLTIFGASRKCSHFDRETSRFRRFIFKKKKKKEK